MRIFVNAINNYVMLRSERSERLEARTVLMQVDTQMCVHASPGGEGCR
jgi:hypothetical protein